MNSSRVTFTLALADGVVHDCVGRLVFVVPAKPRSRTAREPEPQWVIHLLSGPDLHDHVDKHGASFDIVLCDGREARVVIVDGATVRGVSELATPELNAT